MDQSPFVVLDRLKDLWRVSGPGVQGTTGQVLRVLFGQKHEVSPMWVESEIVEKASVLAKAPDHVRYPAIASIVLPARDIWIEFERGGERIGLLADTFDQGIGIRRVTLSDRIEGLQVAPVMTIVELPKERPRVDWTSIGAGRWNAQSPKWERVWRDWAVTGVGTGSTEEDSFLPDQAFSDSFLTHFGIADLIIVALVCSGHFNPVIKVIGKDDRITTPTEGTA